MIFHLLIYYLWFTLSIFIDIWPATNKIFSDFIVYLFQHLRPEQQFIYRFLCTKIHWHLIVKWVICYICMDCSTSTNSSSCHHWTKLAALSIEIVNYQPEETPKLRYTHEKGTNHFSKPPIITRDNFNSHIFIYFYCCFVWICLKILQIPKCYWKWFLKSPNSAGKFSENDLPKCKMD